jgi:hypothetical protein
MTHDTPTLLKKYFARRPLHFSLSHMKVLVGMCTIFKDFSHTKIQTLPPVPVMLLSKFPFFNIDIVNGKKESSVKIYNVFIFTIYFKKCGPGSSVGIANGYRLEGPEIESRWG